ncbi:hypothetical protein PHMEG_00028303 [Phytophthora megakarya]|uniref:Eukaryotic/viral aspartic protease n=1 Tax=Phytophthora megakarya TaxID=4795 RepID=A0A225V593_9STRA|nr:hypothetical protein PHMEG_00028303 [Phytophthora megakarya]
MKSKQATTQAQLNQRVDQAFQAIQMLAARPGVIKSVTIPNVEAATTSVQVSTGPVDAVPNETTSNAVVHELKAAETQFEERWQRREAEAEMAKESWAANLQKILNDQWESVMSAQMQPPTDSPESETKYEKGDFRPIEEQGSRIAKTSGSRVKSRQTEAKSTGAVKSEDKELTKKELRKKPSRQDEDPSEPSSSGESSEEDDSLSDSDSSSDGIPPYATMVTNAKCGNMLTLRTFTNALDNFDEKQSLMARRRWWDKFLNTTIQTGWTEQLKIYEFKTKMSPVARNWMCQLEKRVRTNWGRLARECKREYCKSRVSDSEKYYTMKQCKDKIALAFLYHLNLAAERADVKFRKSERRCEQHIKRFIKNLTDMSLRSTLADNGDRGGMRQRNSNRAYVAQDDEGADVEQPAQIEQDVCENDAAFQDLSAAIQDDQILDNPNGLFVSREELIHEVYRIMNVGYKPADTNTKSGSSANPRPPVPPAQPAAFQGYQSYNNPDRLEFWEKL